jgi:hypothetical protein
VGNGEAATPPHTPTAVSGARATVPPEAAATTQGRMGSSQTAVMLSRRKLRELGGMLCRASYMR